MSLSFPHCLFSCPSCLPIALPLSQHKPRRPSCALPPHSVEFVLLRATDFKRTVRADATSVEAGHYQDNLEGIRPSELLPESQLGLILLCCRKVAALGVYAALSRALGRKLAYPGGSPLVKQLCVSNRRRDCHFAALVAPVGSRFNKEMDEVSAS